jgi:predicted RNase H-like HicB family nuclease
MNLKSVVWKEGKFYVALNLDVDVSSFGKTKKEAIENLEEALELYFEDAIPKKRSSQRIERPEVVKHSLANA